MTARQRRRARRNTLSRDEREALSHIAQQLDRLQSPVSPVVLDGINTKLSRIETRLAGMTTDATRRGAVAGAAAGALSGSIVTVAILLIRAKLEF